MRIEATEYTPEITFDEITNTMVIVGKSIPENAAEFYEPVLNFLHSIVERVDSLSVDVKLDYFNTSSSKQLLHLFQALEYPQKMNRQVRVIWRFNVDDEDLMEAGEDFQELIDIPFELVAENE